MKKSKLKLDCGDLPKNWKASNGVNIVLIEDYKTACFTAKALRNALANFFMNSITESGGSKYHKLRRYFYIERDGEITSAFDIMYGIKSRFISENVVGYNNIVLVNSLGDKTDHYDDFKLEVDAYNEFMLEMNSTGAELSIGHD